MTSGLYKYIVFEPIERSTGKVYEEPCHRIMGTGDELPEHRLGGRRTTGACRSTTRRRGRPTQPVLTRRRVSRVLVTGGSGFIGSHVVDKLADAGIEPRIYDLQPSPHHQQGCVDTVIGDLFDADALRGAMEDCDAVVHLAAYADVGIVAEEPVDAEETNSRGTLAVLEAARATGTRVVYGSTIWVYGASGDGLIDEEAPLGLPDHLYTASKLAGEMYCTSYAELYDVPCTILRFGIPYGPRARPAAVIPIFVSEGAQGRAADDRRRRPADPPLRLRRGPRRGRRRRASSTASENRVYNLAGDETVTIRELADVVSEPDRRHRDRPHAGPQRRLRRRGDLERARRRGARLARLDPPSRGRPPLPRLARARSRARGRARAGARGGARACAPSRQRP